MGETFYAFLLEIFGGSMTHHTDPDRVVSAALSNLSMFVAYLSLAFTLLWLTTKSVLLRRTLLVYLFAAFIGLSGVGHLGHVVGYPDWLTYVIEFTAAVVSLFTAYVLWTSRHTVLSMVYQFKYVIGLLKSIDTVDEVAREKTP